MFDCQVCGACCKTYAVSFYWAEPEAGGLPPEASEPVTPFLARMRGTSGPNPRCLQLVEADCGSCSCGVYEHRPTPCRELQPGEPKCLRARSLHGISPTPEGHGC